MHRIVCVGRTATAALLLFTWSFACAAEGPATVDPVAEADPAVGARGQEIVEARELFRKGVEFAVAGRWQDALSAFERSGRLRPHVVTTYNVGFCERKLGRYTRAARAFAVALEQGNAARVSALPAELEAAARKWLREIDALLATVSVTVESSDTLLLVDGRPLAFAGSRGARPVALGSALDPGAPERVPSVDFDVRLDPGTHVFRFFVSGRKEWEIVRTVHSGEALTIAAATAAPEPLAPRKEDRPRAEPVPSPAGRKVAYVAVGVGGAGVAVGTTFGILALVTRSNLSSACAGSSCPPDRSDDVARLGTYSDLATAGFAIGIGALCVGAIVLVSSGGSTPARRPAHGSATSASTLRIVPGSLGLRGTF